MLSMGGIMYLAHLAFFYIIFTLTYLELGVAILQAYAIAIASASLEESTSWTKGGGQPSPQSFPLSPREY